MIPRRYPGLAIIMWVFIFAGFFICQTMKDDDYRTKEMKANKLLLGDSLYNFVVNFDYGLYNQTESKKDKKLGKLILLEYYPSNYFDRDLFLSVDSNLRAKNINELESIIAIEEQKSIVGKYSNGGSAQQIHLILHFIDVQSRSEFDRCELDGAEPPREITKSVNSTEGSCGARPTHSEIVNCILSKRS